MESTGKRPVAGIIYADNKKRYIPLMFALPIAFTVSLLTLIIFNIIGAGSNAILAQIEVVLLAIFFCLPGILTRSKLRGLIFSVPITWAVILVYELLIAGLFGAGSYNPYAAFNVLKDPILNIIESQSSNLGFNANTIVFGSTTVSDLLSYLIVLDLLIVGIVIFLGSFFVSAVATLFWNKEGDLSIIAVIFKPIALIFAIIFLFVLPIGIHAASSATGAAGYVVAGMSEMLAGFTSPGTVVVAGQVPSFDLDLNIENLRLHSDKAKDNFNLADDRFSQLRGNIFLSFAIDRLPSSLQNVDTVLDVVGTLAEVSGVLPELFLTFTNIRDGFLLTGSALDSNPNTYDPQFATGLESFNQGFSNFTYAWNCGGIKNCGLVYGIERAQGIEEIDAISELVNIGEFVDTLDTAIGALNQSWAAIPLFLNGTYKTLIATSALKDNNFSSASSWITDATGHFEESDAILGAVEDVGPVNITVNTDPPGVLSIPIDSVLHLAKDLISLLIPFSYSAASGINFFEAMRDLMIGMDNLDMSSSSTIDNTTQWDLVEDSLDVATSEFSSASANISLAENLLTNFIATPRYGDLNPVFVGNPGEDTIFRTFEDVIGQFSGNLSALSDVLLALTHTFKAFRNFGIASALMDDYIAAPDNATRDTILSYYENAKTNSSEAWFVINGKIGTYDGISSNSNLNGDSKQAWSDILVGHYDVVTKTGWTPSDEGSFTYPGLEAGTYNGIFVASAVMSNFIETLNLTELNTVLGIIDGLGLGTLFG